eukprot:Nitzschia sp. Nitz4//scaffold8_size234185//151877//153292//NITZ4_001275-RA/size234185-processed-gene-0.164-mRNA-1//-1//CDS//3329559860//2052//frame0
MSDEAQADVSSLSSSQERILASLSLLSGLLSFVASSAIIFMVVQSKQKSPYKRILLGLSVSDLVASVTYATGPFLLPTETSPRVWARGNTTTCHLGGFLVQLSFAALWYNGFLSFYYLATVRYGVSTSAFAKRFEPWIHMTTIGWHVGSALMGLVYGMYDELVLGQSCWIGEVPDGCMEDDSCIGDLIAWGISGIWAIFFFLAVLVNNIVIYRYVRRTLERSKQRSMRGATAFEDRLKAVATQGFLYVGSFLACYSWAFAVRVMESNGIQASDESRFFALYACQAFFLPLQGCFNLLIYTRPTYQQCRRDHPHESRWWVIRRVMFGKRVVRTDGATTTLSSIRGVHSSALSLCHHELRLLPYVPSEQQPNTEEPAESTSNTSVNGYSSHSKNPNEPFSSQVRWLDNVAQQVDKEAGVPDSDANSEDDDGTTGSDMLVRVDATGREVEHGHVHFDSLDTPSLTKEPAYPSKT